MASNDNPSAATNISLNPFYSPLYRLETPDERNLTVFLTTGYYKTGLAFYHNLSVPQFDPASITDNTKVALEFTSDTLLDYCDGKFTFIVFIHFFYLYFF